MRLPLLAALGIATTLGIIAFDATDASALTTHKTIVKGARGTAIVKRQLGARGAVVVKRPLLRGAIIMHHH